MDEIKNNAALEAEQTTALAPAAPAEEPEEESLILKFRKPYKFEGVEYTEVDLSGMEDMTTADLCAVGKVMAKQGMVTPMPEVTVIMPCTWRPAPPASQWSFSRATPKGGLR